MTIFSLSLWRKQIKMILHQPLTESKFADDYQWLNKGKSEKISIKINQTAITQVPEKRVIIIDKKLTFKPHKLYKPSN